MTRSGKVQALIPDLWPRSPHTQVLQRSWHPSVTYCRVLAPWRHRALTDQDRFPRSARMHQTIGIDHIIRLYRTYAVDLDRVREKQRTRLPPPTSLKAQLDDIEAEIAHLLLREARPGTVVGIGTFHGWSTTWILQARRTTTPATSTRTTSWTTSCATSQEQLSAGCWTFPPGDARENLEKIPDTADFLFIDAVHDGRATP